MKTIAKKNKIRLHLDGARALNAAIFLGISPKELTKDFDTVNFCLSKGMGCPVGSLIIGSRADIEHAQIIAKLLGGKMRQAGVLAACGLVSLDDWEEKLKMDHENAKFFASLLSDVP